MARTRSTAHVVELVRKLKPDLVVTETGDSPVGDYVRALREANPSTRVIVLTAEESTSTVEAALEAGAVAYVIKTALPDDFTVAVRQAFSHSVFLPATNGKASAHVEPAQPRHELTRREQEILILVAAGESNASVAKQLWVTEQTVKFHLSNIYRKLEVANRTEASRWAQLHGLLPTVPEAASAA